MTKLPKTLAFVISVGEKWASVGHQELSLPYKLSTSIRARSPPWVVTQSHPVGTTPQESPTPSGCQPQEGLGPKLLSRYPNIMKHKEGPMAPGLRVQQGPTATVPPSAQTILIMNLWRLTTICPMCSQAVAVLVQFGTMKKMMYSHCIAVFDL